LNNNEYVSLKSFTANVENPFLFDISKDLVIYKRNKMSGKTKDLVIVQEATGEIEGKLTMLAVEEYDREVFGKVYLKNMQMFLDLTPAGNKMFWYVFSRIKPNQDYFLFDLTDCKQFTKYKSKVQIVKGLTNLIEKGVIARSTKSYMYFFNPAFIFNGDRVNFVKQIRRKAENKNQLSLEMEETQIIEEITKNLTNEDFRSKKNPS